MIEPREMDLIQAQIGSLATDLSRIEAKVSSGGEDFILKTIYIVDGIDVPQVPVAEGNPTFEECWNNKEKLIIEDYDYSDDAFGTGNPYGFSIRATKLVFTNTTLLETMATLTGFHIYNTATPYTGRLIIVNDNDVLANPSSIDRALGEVDGEYVIVACNDN